MSRKRRADSSISNGEATPPTRSRMRSPSETHSEANDTNGPARTRNEWGIELILFGLQVVTGLLLMTVYSPSTTTAWSSVWYIQTQVPGGWLIRGLHHFASDALLIVLVLHAILIVIRKAYRGPGAKVWWTALALIFVTLALSLSGHLLPWDQAGYWGTKVRTNILARTPVIGDVVRRVLVGGSEFGHLTLTRFYTLHIMLLPALAALLLLWPRLAGAYRPLPTHTVGPRAPVSYAQRPGSPFGDTRVAALSILVLVGVFVVTGYTHNIAGTEWLDAPADATASGYPARPEWHTLFLYQGLKYFTGAIMEVVGAIILPGLLAAVFVGFPFFERLFRPRVAHAVALISTGAMVVMVTFLSYAAILADQDPPTSRITAIEARRQSGEMLTEADQALLRARTFNRQRQLARRVANRALALAAQKGIPPEGPLALLADDPQTRGPILFAAHCASCHRFNGHDGTGEVPVEPADSSDLGGYASRAWIRRLLANPMDERYFGRMTKPDGQPAHTRMSRWVREAREESEDEGEEKEFLESLDAVAAYLEDESLTPGRFALAAPADDTGNAAESPTPDTSGLPVAPGSPDGSSSRNAPTSRDVPSSRDTPGSSDTPDESVLRRGRAFFLAVCNECHSYRGQRWGTLKAPEMYGYGSVAWIEKMIENPSRDTRYRDRGREPAQMPAFADRLSQHDRRLIARWLHDSRQ